MGREYYSLPNAARCFLFRKDGLPQDVIVHGRLTTRLFYADGDLASLRIRTNGREVDGNARHLLAQCAAPSWLCYSLERPIIATVFIWSASFCNMISSHRSATAAIGDRVCHVEQ